jgi:hypothetical protein
MTAAAPFKTQLGHDELRSRAHKLGQRHRTILVLIDGRRPLAEVLGLALQAGAATHHFEDLLRLGLVELPPEPSPPLLRVPEEAPSVLTSVELLVPAGDDAAVTTPMPLVVEPTATPVGGDDGKDVHIAAAAPAAPAVVPSDARPPPQPPVLHQVVDMPSPDIALPLPDALQAQLLQQVRELLADTLRLDAPLFSARIFMRVRNAQSSGELIALVWEIEEHLSHRRRSRRELQSLQHARELLGLGNTLVSDESRPPFLDE